MRRTTSSSISTGSEKKDGSDIQLDSNSSSDDSETELTLKQRDRHPSPALSTASTVKVTHVTQASLDVFLISVYSLTLTVF